MINDKKVLTVVTARGGSKGVPGKNYRDFCGKPLVCWSVLAGRDSCYTDKVAISSNCDMVHDAIQDVRSTKTHWIQRPDPLASDLSKNEAALTHAYYEMFYKYDFDADIIVNLQPTSPIRTNHLLDQCIQAFEVSDADSLLTVNSETPFFWKIENDIAVPMYDVEHRKMRQELTKEELVYHDNGNIYIMTKDTLLNRFCRIGEDSAMYETDAHQSLQIDTETDFEVLETICQKHYNSMPIGVSE